MSNYQLGVQRSIAVVLAVVTISSSLFLLASVSQRDSPFLVSHTGQAGSQESRTAAVQPSLERNDAAGLNNPTVLSTLFPNYNGSLPGNFPSTVADWQVGTPALVPNLNEIWLPQIPTSAHGPPAPETAPALIYNISSNSFVGFAPQLSNISALTMDPSNGLLYGTDPSNDTVEVYNPTLNMQVGRSIPVGSNPDAIVYDPSSEYIFAANRGSNNVTVINSNDDTIVYAGVAVGRDPGALADDYRDGLVYAANENDSFLSILDAMDPTTVEPQVELAFGSATSIAYSGYTGRIVATFPQTQNITVIDAAKKAVLFSPISVGLGVSMAGVNPNGSTFVLENVTGSSLVLVNASTGAVGSMRVTVGADPTQLVDSTHSGFVFAWSATLRAFSVVNLTGDTASGTSPSLETTPGPTAFDNELDALFVADSGSPGVDVIAGSSGRALIPQIVLSGAATGLVATPSTHTLYVSGNNYVSYFDDRSGRLLRLNGSLSGENGPLALNQRTGTLWVGRTGSDEILGLNATSLVAIGSTPPVGVNPADSESVTIDTATNELFAVNATDDSVSIFNATNGQRVAPDIHAGAGVTSVVYDSADSLVYAVGAELNAINPGTLQLAGPPISLPNHAVVGGITFDPASQILSVTTSNASGSGTLSEIPGSSYRSGSSELTTVPLGRGSIDPVVAGALSDSLPGSTLAFVSNAGSGTVTLLASLPSIQSFSFVPSSVGLNETTDGSVTASGGVGAVSVTYSGLPRGCSSEDTLNFACTPSESGSFQVTATISDALGEMASSAATLSVGALFSLSTSFGSHGLSETDLGLPYSVTATASGGAGPYTYLWQFGDGSSSTGGVTEHTYTALGVYVAMVTATDATGATVSASKAVDVSPLPSAEVELLPSTTVDADVAVSLTATVNGGSSPGTASWQFGDGGTATGLGTTHSWTTVGGGRTSYQLNFSYEDAAGAFSNKSVSVAVNPALTGTFSVNAGSKSTVTPDESLVFTASPSGGTAPDNATWSFGDGTESVGLTVHHQYATAGLYVVTVVETDGGGGMVSSTLDVQVASSPTSGASPFSGNFGPGLILGLVVGGAAAAVALFAAERTRRKPAMPAPSPYVVPPTRPRAGRRP